MTITLDSFIYEGLCRLVAQRQRSQYIEDLLRPLVVEDPIEAGYAAMAKDRAREQDAQEWTNALAQDMAHEAR